MRINFLFFRFSIQQKVLRILHLLKTKIPCLCYHKKNLVVFM